MAILGTGASYTFSGFVAEVQSISLSIYQRDPVETTHLGTTGARTFIAPDLYDAGTIDIEFQFDDGDDFSTPASGTAQTLTVTYSSGDTVAASSLMTGIDWNISLEEIQTGTASFKLLGDITWGTGA